MEDLLNILKTKTSDKVASDLQDLALKAGYDSIRFFIAPDKNVSAEAVIEDTKAFFEAEKNGEILEEIYKG